MTNELKLAIRSRALQMGCNLFGVTKPIIDERAKEAYRQWIAKGGHESMEYLSNNIEKRFNPSLLLKGVKSIICIGISYYQTTDVVTQDGRVAMYAWGADYHRIVKDILHRLAIDIQTLAGKRVAYRVFVDSAPVMERTLAAQAGLGWIGRNGLLMNKQLGSFFFLGELFVDIELEPDHPTKNHCGTCRRCIDACPTHAIPESHETASDSDPYSTHGERGHRSSRVAPPNLFGGGFPPKDHPQTSLEVPPTTTSHTPVHEDAPESLPIDVGRCISYLTIEHKGDIDPNLASNIPPWIYGCDQCQLACPFNRFAKETTIDNFKDCRRFKS